MLKTFKHIKNSKLKDNKSNFSKAIRFDEIHTNEKQNNLDRMMQLVNKDIKRIKNKNKHLKTCPVCQGSNLRFFVKKYEFKMDKCQSCGLIFCNPYPSKQQIYHYYNSEMKKFENDFFKKSFENRLNIFYPRIEIIKKYRKSGKILDIGSSIGVFLEALNRFEHNFQLTCCDIDKDSCDKLKKRYPKVDVINSDFVDIEKKPEYDIITMWDTVEHIVDQNLLFNCVKKMLRKDGLFFFSTPNTDSFEWIVANTEHVQLLPPGHVNLLNIKSISKLLKNNGFSLKNYFTLNPSLDVDYVLKLKNKENANRISQENYLVSLLSNQKFRVDFEKILKKHKKAGNILVIAQNTIEKSIN